MKNTILVILSIFWFITGAFAQKETAVKEYTNYKTDFDILYRDKTKEKLSDYMESRCRLDVYYPANKKDFPTVVWFHGGGLLEGERFIPENLRNNNIAVVAVNYRLSPKVTCPTYIDDAAAAVAWIFNNIGKYGGNPNRIYVSGHSAGGYLTLMVGLDKKWLEQYSIDANKIAGLFPFSGQTITHSTIKRERKVSEVIPQIDEFAPLSYAREDAPPLFLITGDKDLDMPARYAENAYLLEIMKAVGNKRTQLFQLEGFDHNEMINPACYIILKYILK